MSSNGNNIGHSPIISNGYTNTLWYTNIAIENGPVEIVDLPSYKLVIFHSYVAVYRVL